MSSTPFEPPGEDEQVTPHLAKIQRWDSVRAIAGTTVGITFILAPIIFGILAISGFLYPLFFFTGILVLLVIIWLIATSRVISLTLEQKREDKLKDEWQIPR